MRDNDITSHYTKNRMAFEDLDGEKVANQITSVQSYLETIRRNPGGINFGGQRRKSFVTQSRQSAEFNNTRNTILLAKSNIRNGEDIPTSLSDNNEKDQLINVQCAYDDTVSNFAPGNRGKINNSNCNIACTKTTAIKPVRISSSIKDIQGMLVSNLNATTSYFNNCSDAKFSVGDSPCRKVDLNSLPNHTKDYCCNTNISRDESIVSNKTVDKSKRENSILHCYGVSYHSKPLSSGLTRQILSGDALDMSEKLVDKKPLNGNTADILTSGRILRSKSSNNNVISSKLLRS